MSAPEGPDARSADSRPEPGNPAHPGTGSSARPPTHPRTGVAGLLRDGPPAGPTRPGFWRSPLRGPWLTSVFGAVLLVGIPLMFVTGLLSYAAYNPDLGGNDKTPDRGWLGFYLFPWPTDPHWLYRLTQGVHVTLGIVLIPVLLAKLWSVVPRLFSWPPVKSLSHALERLSLLLLVGGVLFEFATGLLNIQLDYVFPGSFYTLHFYGAWVFIGAFVVHVAFRVPLMVRMLREGGLREELRRPGAGARADGRGTDRAPGPTGPAGPSDVADPAGPSDSAEPSGPADPKGPADETGLTAPEPAAPTISRRGALGMVGAGSLLLLAMTAGQSIGGAWRGTALLAPRGQDPGPGPNGFQVNKTAAGVGIRPRDVGSAWRLVVRGQGRERVLTRSQVLALPQHSAALPIACVEGWSTEDQLWSGVRLRDLAALVGFAELAPGVFVQSAQRSGSFRSTTLRDNQVRDARSLLALRVNGADLSADHGYPARVIVPANPGVHNTKWVTTLTFGDSA
ncbi:molybdopterin-dependent oxidoreductase [Streptomyces microflavus]|uniref:molybdopterin-dependent oxidoreductase n=1 Tax=Streptomyces microflavus TaxID=1919 RepID=UPI0033CB3CF8